MSRKNRTEKIVKIEEKPKTPANTPENPDTNGQENPAEANVQYTFGYCLRHPIKAVKHAFDEHPVASTAAGVAVAGGLAFGVKCLVDAIGGGDGTDEEAEDLDDVLEDEDEDDEEEI